MKKITHPMWQRVLVGLCGGLAAVTAPFLAMLAYSAIKGGDRENGGWVAMLAVTCFYLSIFLLRSAWTGHN